MNEINEQLKAINVHLSIIDSKTQLINVRLDELIKALHEYDDDQLHCEYSGLPSVKSYSNEEYGESSFEAFQDDKATTNTNALNIVGVKYQKQYNLNRDKMANDHYELGGEG
jgi:Fe-S-cluster formation regulator IscX/YfhJ